LKWQSGAKKSKVWVSSIQALQLLLLFANVYCNAIPMLLTCLVLLVFSYKLMDFSFFVAILYPCEVCNGTFVGETFPKTSFTFVPKLKITKEFVVNRRE